MNTDRPNSMISQVIENVILAQVCVQARVEPTYNDLLVITTRLELQYKFEALTY